MTEDKTSIPIVSHVQIIAEAARASEMKDEFLQAVAPSAKKVAEYLECSEIQAILFCIIFNLNFRSITDISDIGNYLNCSMIRVTTYLKDINVLVEKKIIRSNHGESKKRRRPISTLNSYEYSVNKDVFESIIQNEGKFTAKSEKLFDIFDLLKACSAIIKDNSFDEEEMTQEIISIVQENFHIPFLQAIDQFDLPADSIVLYIALCIAFVAGEDDEIDLPRVLEQLFDYRDAIRIRREFVNSQHPLLVNGLVQLENSSFRSDRTLILTEKSLEMLLHEDKTFFIKHKKDAHNLILAKNIPEKKLFFSGELEKQLNFLTSALTEPHYSELRTRLKNSGAASSAIVVLLHGLSGCGKSEYVYQLARSTKRDLIRVNISETKSKWFGESEKLIKKIFDDYKKRVESSKIIPLLLFNEADGIISSRKILGNTSSGVSQTENSIQNIILQELEEIDGIFLATTNLTQNLDSAIARRSLFKVHFKDFGNKETRYSIWSETLNRISNGQSILAQNDILHLSDLQMSGGQIDNVVKKVMMIYILEDRYPTLSEIMEFCTEETGFLKEEKKKIGY